MAPSLPALPLLLALVLGIALPAQAYDQLDYCQPPRICPRFTRISTNQKYEERLYESHMWMCTVGDGTDSFTVSKASLRLMDFRSQQSWIQAVKTERNTWPSLVKARQVAGGQEFRLCWLVPPGLTPSSSGKVVVETFPKASVFVRSFVGRPTLEEGQKNAEKLMQDLTADGKGFDRTIYLGASYDSYGSFDQHIEIWVLKR